jgi:hypothetical protein
MPLLAEKAHDWWHPPQDWVACFQGEVDDLLYDEVIQREPYSCSTVGRRHPAPCICCVQGTCFRDLRLVANHSEDLNVADRLPSGVALVRPVPKQMDVCLVPVDSDEPNCTSIAHAADVSDYLRARELLRGWAPAGTEYVEHKKPWIGIAPGDFHLPSYIRKRDKK